MFTNIFFTLIIVQSNLILIITYCMTDKNIKFNYFSIKSLKDKWHLEDKNVIIAIQYVYLFKKKKVYTPSHIRDKNKLDVIEH